MSKLTRRTIRFKLSEINFLESFGREHELDFSNAVRLMVNSYKVLYNLQEKYMKDNLPLV